MTNKVERLIKKKKRLYKKARKLKDSKSTKAFHDFVKKFVTCFIQNIIGILTTYWSQKVIKPLSRLWKYIKLRKQDSVSIGTLEGSGRIADNAKDKAEMFNETFCSVFTKENLDNIPDKGQSPY